jgi:serine/threonine protein kinase
MSDRHQPNGSEQVPTDHGENVLPEADTTVPPGDAEPVPATEAYDHVEGDSLDDSFDTSVLAAASNSSSLGRLGKYEILKVIGRGGMGIVFRGFDESLHRAVAIKVLSRQLATSPTARRRFTREARAAAAINHPNVVTIHAVEDQEGLPYLVMEFVNGQSLHDRIRDQAPLPLADVLRLGSQIAAGLSAAHAQGVIHRDIKPANIMLEDNVERVKITDFGLARVAMDNTELTSQGHRLGTPAYMSPEQVSGTPVDERTDLFSFGCVLYAMLTGQSPFRGTHSFDAARKILEETPQSLDRVNPDVPPFMAEIVDRLLAKKPSSRFRSAAEVADLLNSYTTRLNQTRTDELGTFLRGETLSSSKGHSLKKLIVVLSIAAVGLLIAFIWKPWEKRENEVDPGPAVALQEASTPTVTPLLPETKPAKAEVPKAFDAPPTDTPLLRGTLTVAQSGESQFSSINEALRRAGPGAMIEVLDDAVYDGAVDIADAERLRDITVYASHGAKLIAPFPSSVININSTPGVTIRGFQVEAFHGQHGLEITGPCPGTLVEDITAQRVPNTNSSPALINFAYLHAAAAGSEEAPIVLRKLTLRGGGHSIAIGELSPTESDVENPVRWVRVEDCTFVNPDGRTNYRLFFLNYVADVLITRNTFSDAEIGISMLLNEPNQVHRIKVHQNTFHNLGSLMTVAGNFAQDELALTSNLISRTDRVTPGQVPPSELPTPWFSDNAWIDQQSTTDPAASAVATIVKGVAFQSEDSATDNYLRPTAESSESLRSVGSAFPGRFESE